MSNNPFGDVPESSPYAPPHASGYQPAVGTGTGDATGGVIPYKNPAALAAYYLGLFSLLPCLGLALAIPALIFGIMGLVHRKRNPVIKGSVHAWIGIVLGGLFTILWGALGILVLASIFLAER